MPRTNKIIVCRFTKDERDLSDDHNYRLGFMIDPMNILVYDTLHSNSSSQFHALFVNLLEIKYES